MWIDDEPSTRPMWVAGLVLLMVLAVVALLST